MKHLLFFLSIIVPLLLSAQTFNISNQVTFGGDNIDYIKSIIYTKDNCILVAGPTMSGATGDKTDTLRGREIAFKL